MHLNPNTVALAEGATGICCFVNDELSAPVLTELKSRGVQFILLRCAGFNQVDIIAAKQLGLQIARVPDYSPCRGRTRYGTYFGFKSQYSSRP